VQVAVQIHTLTSVIHETPPPALTVNLALEWSPTRKLLVYDVTADLLQCLSTTALGAGDQHILAGICCEIHSEYQFGIGHFYRPVGYCTHIVACEVFTVKPGFHHFSHCG
jgi:hypothetical protein